MTLEIIPRDKWGAAPPRGRSTIPLPSPQLWLHHSADNARGALGVRQIQRFHMRPKSEGGRGWSDIAYSYLIDRVTLEVYEGRGAGILGGHTFGRNSVSHGICVMGNFDKAHPSAKLLGRIAELVAHGHRQGWWPALLSGGHRQVRPTSCPGDHLFAQIPNINDRTTRLLRPGANMPPPSTDPDPIVKRSQERLIAAGFPLPRFGADGYWGDESDRAVELAVSKVAEATREIARLESIAAELAGERDGLRAELRDALAKAAENLTYDRVGAKAVDLFATIRAVLDG